MVAIVKYISELKSMESQLSQEKNYMQTIFRENFREKWILLLKTNFWTKKRLFLIFRSRPNFLHEIVQFFKNTL